MTAVCPEGHTSLATDYCDTCGAPIGAAAAAPAAEPSVASPDPVAAQPLPESAPTQACPHCGATNHADALFCEDCGYDFTTGAAPLGDEPPATEPGEPQVVEPEGEADAEPAPEPDPDHDADPDPDPGADPDPRLDARSTPPEPEPDAEPADAEPDADPDPGLDARSTPPDPEPDPAPVPDAPARPAPRHTPPSRALADAWVVEIWVDPDWYAVQQTAEAIPSPGVPDIVLVRRNVALIGRPSGSMAVRPEVDAGSDSAVSRRHAQLTSDGRRWWVEDLGSSNGTFVGTVGEPLPTSAVPAGQRVELDRDQRVYVGAWTRLALRPATASELEGHG